jgi:hypothetical protein
MDVASRGWGYLEAKYWWGKGPMGAVAPLKKNKSEIFPQSFSNKHKQDGLRTYNVTLESRSCNNCCRWKAISSTYSECVSHSSYCHLWPVGLYHTLPHYLIKGTNFGKKNIEGKNVFWISLRVARYSYKVPVLMNFLDRLSNNTHENPSSVNRNFPCGRTWRT